MTPKKQKPLDKHLPSHDLPVFRLHQCGEQDVEIRPLASNEKSAHQLIPIYVKDKCGGETIVEIHIMDYVQVKVFHSCANHMDIGTVALHTSVIHPHTDAIMMRLAE